MAVDPTDFCTVADVYQDLRYEAGSNTVEAPLVQAYITSASQAINAEYDREFTPLTSSATRRFQWDGESALDLAPYDLRSASAVTLHPEQTSPVALVANSDYVLAPVEVPNGVYERLQMSSYLAPRITSTVYVSFGFAFVDVAGAWGWPSLPANVKQACITTVSSWLRRDHTGLAILNDDTPREFDPQPGATFAIPAAARRLLAPYRRGFAL